MRGVGDLDGALGAIDAEPQVVEVAGGEAAGMDDADGAVLEADGHGEAVVGVEVVVADLVAGRLVEGLEAAGGFGDLAAAP